MKMNFDRLQLIMEGPSTGSYFNTYETQHKI